MVKIALTVIIVRDLTFRVHVDWLFLLLLCTLGFLFLFLFVDVEDHDVVIVFEVGFDLRTEIGQKKAWEVIKQEQPDLIVCAFSCTPWSPLRNLGLSQPGAAEKLAADLSMQPKV